MTLAKAKSIPYDCNLVLKYWPYDGTVITILNYGRKNFIVQVTDPKTRSYKAEHFMGK